MLPPEPMLLLEDMSRTMVLWPLGFVMMMSQDCVTTRGHAEIPGLDCGLRQCAELALTLDGHHSQES